MLMKRDGEILRDSIWCLFRLRMILGLRLLRKLREVSVLILVQLRVFSDDVPRTLASDELKDAARAWIDKLSVKNGAYPPDSYPNPGRCFLFLAFWLAVLTVWL